MVAKVYARFKPDTKERDRWETIASARDAEKWGRFVALVVALMPNRPRTNMKKPPQAEALTRVTRIAGAGLEPATPAL